MRPVMKLKKVCIHKYKSFESNQNFELDDGITILVGMNESGKTSALEAIAKTNYFQEDKSFKFNFTHDYPRKEKKKIDKTGTNPNAITCTYGIPTWLIDQIKEDIGEGILTTNEFTVTHHFKTTSKTYSHLSSDIKKLITSKTKKLNISSKATNDKLLTIKSKEEFNDFVSTFKDEKYIAAFKKLKKYFEFEWNFRNPIDEYICKEYLKPNLPKFLYYDEYFTLPSRISIEKLEKSQLEEKEYKTGRALFELADINTTELLQSDDFEDFIAELEATEAIISEELFKYWKTNKNLQITFQMDKKEDTDAQNNTKIIEHILDIRVKSKGVSLPLKNRSKGFNWFFSFLVWFKRIQEDDTSNYILLLDEPGLNLHASAQSDLLRFLEDLAENYQIIYTTHSPFMIPSENLNRVKTILETPKGSIISDSIQEKDPKTLFPLQAALGYDIAQNLFVSPKNLLVEGVSDLIILTALSGILESQNRNYLRPDITIVPTGGLEKVATFISLLRGQKLEMVCLLDSYNDAKGKARMDKMVMEKIIHKNKIRFFTDYLDGYTNADLEDVFMKEDYLKFFNSAFSEYSDINISELNPSIKQIIIQINKHLRIDRFNHYRPANQIIKSGADNSNFSSETLDNFDKIFADINILFE